MNKAPSIKLTWHGLETVESIKKLLDDVKEIKVVLPFNFNHAIFHELCPDSTSAEMEDINISGGAEIISKLANLSGLEEMEGLVEILDTAKAKVRIISPPMVIISCQ